MAIAWALLMATVTFPFALPSMLRVPVKAAASAAFWQSVLAAAIRPTSIPRATNPHRATRQIANMGRIVPRRRWPVRMINMLVLRSCESLAAVGVERDGSSQPGCWDRLISFAVHGGRILQRDGIGQKLERRKEGAIAHLGLYDDRLPERCVLPGPNIGIIAIGIGLIGVERRDREGLICQEAGEIRLKVRRWLRIRVVDGIAGRFAGGIGQQLPYHDDPAVFENGEHEEQTGTNHDGRLHHRDAAPPADIASCS